MSRTSWCVLFAALAFSCLIENATATETTGGQVEGAPRPNATPPKLDWDKTIEGWAIAQNNRVKWVMLHDGTGVPCPRLTSLVYASNDRVGFVIPNSVMMNGGIRRDSDRRAGDPSFVFSDARCRFAISITQFALQNGVEREVEPRDTSEERAAILRKLMESARTSRGAAPKSRNTEAGVKVQKGAHGDEIFIAQKDLDPDLIGTFQFKDLFVPSGSDLAFSGIMWLSSKNFSFYLANAPNELSISSQKNSAAKAYVVDIGNQNARFRFSIRKEVLVDNTWVTEFAE
jgi:hypothetical protein